MSSSLSKEWGLTEGQTYIISRKGSVLMDGYIYLDSLTVSTPHAALKIKKERVYLRDLNSTNGTYIVGNDGLVMFDEGYVKPNQPIMIGEVNCTIQGLIAIAGVYSAPENDALDQETEEIKLPILEPVKKTETD